jgi:hypothetical protein
MCGGLLQPFQLLHGVHAVSRRLLTHWPTYTAIPPSVLQPCQLLPGVAVSGPGQTVLLHMNPLANMTEFSLHHAVK